MMESIPGAYKYHGARRCILSNGREYWLYMLKYLVVLYLLQNFPRRKRDRKGVHKDAKENFWVLCAIFINCALAKLFLHKKEKMLYKNEFS